MAIADPVLTIKNLLKANWNAANTSNVTPTFGTGWFNEESKHPQVTVSDATENASGGGETGYDGIMGSGTGPKQTMVGSVDVNVWSTRDASSVNPKQLVWEFSEEVKRIIKAQYDQATDLDWLAFMGRVYRVETDVRPAAHRYQITIRYGYQSTP